MKKQRSFVRTSNWAIWYSSAPADKKEIRKGVARLKELGATVLVPTGLESKATKPGVKDLPFVCSTESEKFSLFKKIWSQKNIDEIFLVRGGYGCIRLLPLFERWKPRAKDTHKRIWGFSDLTTLQNYLYFRFGWSWVHSPMLTSPAFYDPNSIEKSFWEQYFNDPGVFRVEYALKPLFVPSSFKAKKIKLPLVGGNLTCLLSLMGTRFEPKPKKDYFLFLEDTNERAYRIDRMLQQLANTHFFKKCKGVFLGDFSNTAKEDVLLVIESWARQHNVALYDGVPAGHERPNLPLAMGVPVTLFSEKTSTAWLHIPFLRT